MSLELSSLLTIGLIVTMGLGAMFALGVMVGYRMCQNDHKNDEKARNEARYFRNNRIQ